MLKTSNKNDATSVQDSGFKIDGRELEKLLESEKSRNSQMRIEFDDLCYSVRRFHKGTEKTILQDVKGHFEPGKLTVIIGPSGAGKTTLLKIISGKRFPDVKGTITINGVEQNRKTFRKHVCYVQQQFDLMPFLTTRETLCIAARLKLDDNQNKQAISSAVNDIAESLGLSNCLDTLAHKLSGGERKRLSIGVEIIVKPSVLLLDEPTSGLDSVASNQLIHMLHDMARANCTVVCAIHQANSQMISLFDDIMALTRGRCMYCGPKSEILNTYSTAGFTCPSYYNIAEFVLEVITEQRNGDLENLYKICRDEYEKCRLRIKNNDRELNTLNGSKQECQSKDTDTSKNSILKEKSIWQQQKVLFLRALICLKRDTILTKLRIATHLIVALLTGAVYYNFGDDAEKASSNMGYLFFCVFFLFCLNTGLAVLMFPTEATVFLQEYLNNWYSLQAYYSVKILTDLFMQVFCASIFVSISYYMTGQPMEYHRFFEMWIICLLTTIIGQMVGVLTGATFGSEIGIFLAASNTIPLVLFSGFLVKIGELPLYLRLISDVNYFRYALEGVFHAIYLDRPNLTCMEVYCYLRSPRKILSIIGMPTVSFYAILIILLFWIVLLHAITYAVLRWKIYNSKK